MILQSVTTVSYCVTHGFRKKGPISPSRGIRQGNPLSPYLFTVCAEGLSASLRKYEREKWLHGVRICRQAPVITHMLFDDDCYITVRQEKMTLLEC